MCAEAVLRVPELCALVLRHVTGPDMVQAMLVCGAAPIPASPARDCVARVAKINGVAKRDPPMSIKSHDIDEDRDN